ncbi:recombination regulator RecX [Clostridium sediminicola]|uniref:recombination regulator RecX n=1 Tax=Clostridium sediminicola TaxID=3114879 RepID=UPI0031F1C883
MKNKITRMEYGKRNNKRVNVYINDEYAFSCNEELIYKYKLEKDKEIDAEYLEEVINEDNYLKAKISAMKSIERAYKTEKDIRDKLLRSEYNDETIERVIKFLKGYGFVDDEKYCNMYINDKIKKFGKNKIKHDLIKKGIKEKVIENKLKIINTDIEIHGAKKVAQKKLKGINNKYGKRVLYSKVGSYLATKGYSFDIINEILPPLIDTVNNDNNESMDDEGFNHQLLQIAEKKYRQLLKNETDNKKIYIKLSQFLLRKGYDWDEIKRVIKKVIGDEYE